MRERISFAALLLSTVLLGQQAPPAPAAVTTAWLDGVVLDPMGQPVAGARVVAIEAGQELAHTSSGPDGSFSFASLPQASFVVRATTTAPDVGAVRVDLLGERYGFAEVHAGPARAVRGVVRDGAGEPIPGAWVHATPSDPPELTIADCCARCDGEGRFVLEHVVFGRVAAVAWAPGHAPTTATIDGIRDETWEPRLARGGRSLEVTVTDGDARERTPLQLHVEPLGGEYRALPPPAATPAADRPGHWLVEGLPTDSNLVLQVGVGLRLASPTCLVVAAAETPATAGFTLAPGELQLRGTVVDGGDHPLAGVSLLFQPLNPLPGPELRLSTTSRSDGSFVIASPVPLLEAFAARTLDPGLAIDNHGDASSWFVDSLGEARTELRLRLRVAHRVRARFWNGPAPAGPGDAVRLFATRPGTEERTWIGVGTTDRNGAVEITGVAVPVQAELVIEIAGRHGNRSIGGRGAEATDFGDLQVDMPSTLFGNALAKDGTPLPGARLRLSRDISGNDDPRLVVAGRDGGYRRMGLAQGHWYGAFAGQVHALQQRALFAGDLARMDIRHP